MFFKPILTLLFVLGTQVVFAQKLRQVIDLSPGTPSTFTNASGEIVASLGSRVLFTLKNASGLPELWASDGSPAGTLKLHTLSKSNQTFGGFLPYQNELLFWVNEEVSKGEIWRSDATLAGTRRLLETSNSGVLYPVLLGDFLYYASAGTSTFSRDNGLWKLNLSDNKSTRIYEFHDFAGIVGMSALGTKLVIIGDIKNLGRHLFLSDGTTAGTKPYFFLNNGNEYNVEPFFTQVGNKLFFFYDDNTYRLYVTDGTAAGTLAVGKFREIFSLDLQKKRSIIGWNGKLYFQGRAESSSSSAEDLFVSDGTVAGTQRWDIIPDEDEQPSWFTPYRGKLYFMALGAFENEYIYVTEGSKESTKKAITERDLGSGGTFGGGYMTSFRDSLFFPAYREAVGYELWQSDGTTAKTKAFDVLKGSDAILPDQLRAAGTKLFFTASTPQSGRELWVYDPDFRLVSTQELSLELIAKVYPNPTQDRVHLTFKGDFKPGTLQLSDAQGRGVWTQKVDQPNYEFSLKHFAPGHYYLGWQSEGRQYVQQLILQ